jgi:beta-carotene hydroxylase
MKAKKGLLRYKADYRTLFLIFSYFLIAYSGYILFNFEFMKWYIVLPWFMLSCMMAFIMAAIVHNTIHCPIFTRKKWNKAFQLVLSLSYGHSVSAYVPGHNLSHHKQSQTQKDTIRTYRARFSWHLLNQLFFFFIIAPEIVQQEKQWAEKMKTEKPSWYKQYRIELYLVMSIKILLLILNWKAAILFIWVPHFYGTWGILSTNIFQHDGCDENHPYNHTRTFKSFLLNFLTCNNGYHGAHHDKPGMHWSLLPAYHKNNIEPYIHPNLNRNSLLAYCFEAYVWPGKRVDYKGNNLVLKPLDKTGDWMSDIKIGVTDLKEDLGAEVAD